MGNKRQPEWQCGRYARGEKWKKAVCSRNYKQPSRLFSNKLLLLFNDRLLYEVEDILAISLHALVFFS